MTTLQFAHKYEELLAGNTEAAPYDYPTLFKAEDFFARRRAKKRFHLLKAFDQKLRSVLQPGERACFLTPGITVSRVESLFLAGWWAYSLNKRVLVFTTQRVLLLQLDVHECPGEVVSQIPYASIASVKSTWTGRCRVKLLGGKTYDFQRIAGTDRKFLVEYLTGVVPGTSAPLQKGVGIDDLCPHCYSVVPGHPRECATCGGGIKSTLQPALLSFFLPGTGDWYLGHRIFALLEMLVTVFLWFGLVIVPLLAPPVPTDGPHDRRFWLIRGLVLLLAHGLDSVMTLNFARKGHLPTGVGRRFPIKVGPPPTAELPKPDASLSKKLTIKRTPTG